MPEVGIAAMQHLHKWPQTSHIFVKVPGSGHATARTCRGCPPCMGDESAKGCRKRTIQAGPQVRGGGVQMANRDQVLSALKGITLPDGGDIVSRDMVRALDIGEGRVSFVLEADSAAQARQMEPQRAAAEAALRGLPGV